MFSQVERWSCGIPGAIAGDIGPLIRRMHADIDPQLRGMQNQLDNIESAVNLALASGYAGGRLR